MTEQANYVPGVWDRGWDEHKRRQLQRLAELPFESKLEWLEEAHALVKAIQSGKRASGEQNEVGSGEQVLDGTRVREEWLGP